MINGFQNITIYNEAGFGSGFSTEAYRKTNALSTLHVIKQTFNSQHVNKLDTVPFQHLFSQNFFSQGLVFRIAGNKVFY